MRVREVRWRRGNDGAGSADRACRPTLHGARLGCTLLRPQPPQPNSQTHILTEQHLRHAWVGAGRQVCVSDSIPLGSHQLDEKGVAIGGQEAVGQLLQPRASCRPAHAINSPRHEKKGNHMLIPCAHRPCCEGNCTPEPPRSVSKHGHCHSMLHQPSLRMHCRPWPAVGHPTLSGTAGQHITHMTGESGWAAL